MKTEILLMGLVAITILTVTAAPTDDNDDGRIVNGVAIHIQQAPFMVRLSHTSGVYCGGSLIAPSYVLTAAHCMRDRDIKDFVVTANVTTTFSTGVRRRVTRAISHPDYKVNTFHSDIAVLRLNEPIENLKPLNLCTHPVKEGDKLQVFGWGRTAKKQSSSTFLRTAILPVRSQKVCEDEYGKLTKNMFCASGLEDVGTCYGDSGGPAVRGGEVYGIVSFSHDCGVAGSSEVFTDVYKMRDFITNFMNTNEQ